MAATNNTQQNIFLLLVSLVLSLALAEVVLRVVIPPPNVWKYPQEQYLPDPDIGHRLAPNQTSFTHDKVVKTNSSGIRDQEFTVQPRAGVYRIIAIGDSQTFGNGLDSSDTWPKQLEKELNDAGDRLRYEVLNCGIPGSDSWQHEIMLERMLRIYKADGVVLAFYVNDVVEKPSKINLAPEFKKHTLIARVNMLLKQSSLVMALHSAVKAVQLKMTPSESYLRHHALLMGDTSPVSRSRWRQVESSLIRMKLLSESSGNDFMVISLPKRDQVDGRLPAGAFRSHLQKIALDNDIRLFEMHEPLQAAYEQFGEKLFIPWDGHNTGIANSIIAREMVQEVLATSANK